MVHRLWVRGSGAGGTTGGVASAGVSAGGSVSGVVAACSAGVGVSVMGLGTGRNGRRVCELRVLVVGAA